MRATTALLLFLVNVYLADCMMTGEVGKARSLRGKKRTDSFSQIARKIMISQIARKIMTQKCNFPDCNNDHCKHHHECEAAGCLYFVGSPSNSGPVQGRCIDPRRLKSLDNSPESDPKLSLDQHQDEYQESQPGDWPGSDTPHELKLPQCTKSRCHVLMVIDMQNDYCEGCIKSKKNPSPWASKGVRLTADKINELIESVESSEHKFDLVLFTQDWLSDTSDFLKHDTEGAGVLSVLKRPLRKTQFFTKRADDWMNHGYWQGRQYAIRGEAPPSKTQPAPLDQILKQNGYTPSATSLWVTGTATNRCVMKGSVHGRQLGYPVSIVQSAVYGDGEEYDWNRYQKSFTTALENQNIPTGTQASAPCDSSTHLMGWELQEFLKAAFTTRGGPNMALKECILGVADVRICENPKAVVEAMAAGRESCERTSTALTKKLLPGQTPDVSEPDVVSN